MGKLGEVSIWTDSHQGVICSPVETLESLPCFHWYQNVLPVVDFSYVFCINTLKYQREYRCFYLNFGSLVSDL